MAQQKASVRFYETLSRTVNGLSPPSLFLVLPTVLTFYPSGLGKKTSTLSKVGRHVVE